MLEFKKTEGGSFAAFTNMLIKSSTIGTQTVCISGEKNRVTYPQQRKHTSRLSPMSML